MKKRIRIKWLKKMRKAEMYFKMPYCDKFLTHKYHAKLVRYFLSRD